MAKTGLYITLGTAVLTANVMYSAHVANRVSSIENNLLDVQQDVKDIKQAVIGYTPVQIKYKPKDIECLARNIYWEAGNQSMLGKVAVANVTVNRVKHGYWGRNICEVVYKPGQFSWTKVKKRAWIQLKDSAWEDSKLIAQAVLTNGMHVKKLQTALYYHADYVEPNWRDERSKITKIGNHIFYERAKGSWLKL